MWENFTVFKMGKAFKPCVKTQKSSLGEKLEEKILARNSISLPS